MGIPSFDTPDYSELFAEEKEIIAKLKKVFLMVAGSAIQKYGPDLEDHQQLLMAAANILNEVYIAESTLLRAEKSAKRFGEEHQEGQIAMARLYLYNAVEIVAKNGKEGIISFAEGDEQRMLLMGLKRFTKYANYPNVISLRNLIAEKMKVDNKYCF
jgi:propanediol dehydratase large subunit